MNPLPYLGFQTLYPPEDLYLPLLTTRLMNRLMGTATDFYGMGWN